MSRREAAEVLGPSVRDLGERVTRILGIGPREVNGPIAAELIAGLLPLASPTTAQSIEIIRWVLSRVDEGRQHGDIAAADEIARATWQHLAALRPSTIAPLDIGPPTEDTPTEPPSSPSRKAA